MSARLSLHNVKRIVSESATDLSSQGVKGFAQAYRFYDENGGEFTLDVFSKRPVGVEMVHSLATYLPDDDEPGEPVTRRMWPLLPVRH